MPPDSPEWQFYAVLAPMLNAGETQSAAFESRLATQKKRGVSSYRELFAFALSLASFAAIAFFVDNGPVRAPSVALYCGAIALGVAASAVYVWITSRRRKGA